MFDKTPHGYALVMTNPTSGTFSRLVNDPKKAAQLFAKQPEIISNSAQSMDDFVRTSGIQTTPGFRSQEYDPKNRHFLPSVYLRGEDTLRHNIGNEVTSIVTFFDTFAKTRESSHFLSHLELLIKEEDSSRENLGIVIAHLKKTLKSRSSELDFIIDQAEVYFNLYSSIIENFRSTGRVLESQQAALKDPLTLKRASDSLRQLLIATNDVYSVTKNSRAVRPRIAFIAH